MSTVVSSRNRRSSLRALLFLQRTFVHTSQVSAVLLDDITELLSLCNSARQNAGPIQHIALAFGKRHRRLRSLERTHWLKSTKAPFRRTRITSLSLAFFSALSHLRATSRPRRDTSQNRATRYFRRHYSTSHSHLHDGTASYRHPRSMDNPLCINISFSVSRFSAVSCLTPIPIRLAPYQHIHIPFPQLLSTGMIQSDLHRYLQRGKF